MSAPNSVPSSVVLAVDPSRSTPAAAVTTPVPPHLSDEERALWETPERCVFERATVRALLTALSTEREAGERDTARLDAIDSEYRTCPDGFRVLALNGWRVSVYRDGYHVSADPFSEPIVDRATLRDAIDAALLIAPSTETPHA